MSGKKDPQSLALWAMTRGGHSFRPFRVRTIVSELFYRPVKLQDRVWAVASGGFVRLTDKDGKALLVEDGELILQEFHEIGQLSDGTLVGKFGALVYILAPDGRVLSPGFHEVYPIGDGEYCGVVGSAVYRGKSGSEAWECISYPVRELRYPPAKGIILLEFD